MKPTIRFTAKLGPEPFIPLPKSAKVPANEPLEGVINYLPFRAVTASHELKFTKGMRAAFQSDSRDSVPVEITRIGDEAEVRTPRDLIKALKATPKALDSWDDITPLARRDWILSICTAKQAATRKRRIYKACDMLASGKRRLCCFPGVAWIMRDNAPALGAWRKLPTSARTKRKLKTRV